MSGGGGNKVMVQEEELGEVACMIVFIRVTAAPCIH